METGPSAALSTSAKIEVAKGRRRAAPAGLLNEGYWGIAVRPNTRYTGSFYAKSGLRRRRCPSAWPGVADQSGQTLASVPVSVAAHGLETTHGTLKSSLRTDRTSPRPRIILELDGRPPGDAVASVSVAVPAHLPRHGPNGNRIDIMERLAAMRPSFLRFPGGNYVEGSNLNNRFDWKKMIQCWIPIFGIPTISPGRWGAAGRTTARPSATWSGSSRPGWARAGPRRSAPRSTCASASSPACGWPRG